MLAFFAALEGVADAGVKLGCIVDVIGCELTGIKEGEKLGVPGEHGVRAKIGGGFHGLELEDGGASGQQSVIVLDGEADGVVKGNAGAGRLRSVGARGRGGGRGRGLLRCQYGRDGQQSRSQSQSFPHVRTPAMSLQEGRLAPRNGTEWEKRSELERRRRARRSGVRKSKRGYGSDSDNFEPVYDRADQQACGLRGNHRARSGAQRTNVRAAGSGAHVGAIVKLRPKEENREEQSENSKVWRLAGHLYGKTKLRLERLQGQGNHLRGDRCLLATKWSHPPSKVLS